MEIPFQYGKIVEDDSFIDRIEDRKELKGFLSNGINTILVSPRRWGKSSLVKVAMKELAEEDKNIKVCFLDAFKIHSEEEFYDAFASAVIEGVSSTAEKRRGDFVKYIKSISPTISFNDSPTTSVSLNLKLDPLKSNAESILNLPEKMAEDKGVKVIVCIDEFQQLAKIKEWKKLVSTMRSVWQQQHRTTYCLYGSKMQMMTTIFNNTQSPFYKFGQLINLKCISKDYWIPYIVDNFKKRGKKYPRNWRKRSARQSNTIPGTFSNTACLCGCIQTESSPRKISIRNCNWCWTQMKNHSFVKLTNCRHRK